MEKRFIFTICLLFFSMGGLFVTQAITGMYSWDRYTSFCTLDKDCESPNVCCFFYDEDYGVCDEFNVCSSISKMSLEEKQQFSSLQPPSPEMEREKLLSAVKSHIEEPRTDYTRNSLIVGMALMVFAIVVYLITTKNMKPASYGHGIISKKRKKVI